MSVPAYGFLKGTWSLFGPEPHAKITRQLNMLKINKKHALKMHWHGYDFEGLRPRFQPLTPLTTAPFRDLVSVAHITSDPASGFAVVKRKHQLGTRNSAQNAWDFLSQILCSHILVTQGLVHLSFQAHFIAEAVSAGVAWLKVLAKGSSAFPKQSSVLPQI